MLEVILSYSTKWERKTDYSALLLMYRMLGRKIAPTMKNIFKSTYIHGIQIRKGSYFFTTSFYYSQLLSTKRNWEIISFHHSILLFTLLVDQLELRNNFFPTSIPRGDLWKWWFYFSIFFLRKNTDFTFLIWVLTILCLSFWRYISI